MATYGIVKSGNLWDVIKHQGNCDISNCRIPYFERISTHTTSERAEIAIFQYALQDAVAAYGKAVTEE